MQGSGSRDQRSAISGQIGRDQGSDKDFTTESTESGLLQSSGLAHFGDVEVQVPPLRFAPVEMTSLTKVQVPPLRFASVGMTSLRKVQVPPLRHCFTMTSVGMTR